MAEQLKVFEQACADLQQGAPAAMHAAEAQLLELRSSAEAVATAQAFLNQTADPAAQFQALVILRSGVLRDWGATAPEQAEALRTQLLEFTVGRWDRLAKPVRAQLLTLVAIMLKRAWLDQTGAATRAAFFEQVQQLLDAGGEHQALAVRLLLALADEFSFSKFSSVGLAWEFHTRARAAFQEDGELQRVFGMATDLLAQLVPAAATQPPPPALASALQLAGTILSWDFSKTLATDTALSGFFRAEEQLGGGGGGGGAAFLKPGAAWRAVLCAPQSQLAELFFALATHCRGNGRLAHLARGSLISLANLEGVEYEDGVFPDTAARFNHYAALLPRALSWLNEGQQLAIGGSPHEDADTKREELLDGASMLLQLLSNLSRDPKEMEALAMGDGAGGLRQMLALLAQLTTGAAFALESLGSSVDALEDMLEGYLEETSQILLQTWSCLLPYGSDTHCGGGGGGRAALDGMLQEFTPAVFESYLRWRLQICAMKASPELAVADAEDEALLQLKEEEDEDEESEVHLAATLGRFQPAHSLGVLTQLLTEWLPKLIATNAADINGLRQVDSVVSYVLQLTKFVLCDNAHGEMPTVPARLHAVSVQAGADPAVCPVVGLFRLVLSAGEALGGDGGARLLQYPKTTAELMDSWGRLAPTYLTLEQNAREYSYMGGVPPALSASLGFAAGGGGRATVEAAASLGVAVLSQQQPQSAGGGSCGSLSRGAASLLLRLARLKGLRALLPTLSCWAHLLAMIAEGPPPPACLMVLSSTTKRMLAEALTCAGLIRENPESSAAYVRALQAPIMAGLNGLLASAQV